MNGLYIGALTGTSADAISVAAFAFDENPTTVATHTSDIPKTIRETILTSRNSHLNTDQFASISAQLGTCFAQAIHDLINQSSLPREQIQAIGLHGQTIRHRPFAKPPFTLQAIDPNIVCAATGLTTVDDFRRADMAAGGQGAPLAPLFHQSAFSHPNKCRAIINIGGIANITVLQKGRLTAGFDCGPGNALMDYWIQTCLEQRYDDQGQWAATAPYDKALLDTLCEHKFLSKKPPKSTCTSDFNGDWLNEKLRHYDLDAATVQASLVELTAVCIARAIQAYAPATEEVFVCGGGTHNQFLMDRIEHNLNPLPINTTDKLGWHADWVEAATFAWLAKQRLDQTPLHLKPVTGAKKDIILGAVYIPS